MEENFIGYLLGALDPSEQQAVEAYLVAHPEERAKLDTIRLALDPLAADQDAFSPPADLAMRTVAHVAEYLVNTEPRIASNDDTAVSQFLRQMAEQPAPVSAKAPTPRQLPPSSDDLEINSVFRRNIITAVGLAIAFLAIAFPTIASMRHYRSLAACQNNLREYSFSLHKYADIHNGAFPVVKADETAGKMVDILKESGVFPPGATLTCPGLEGAAGQHVCANITPKIDYAYTLGYRDASGELQGVTRQSEELSVTALLADAPLRTDEAAVPHNHHRVHQVLFADGHVMTCTNGNVGYARDNIFYNLNSQVHAGLNAFDSVLGRQDEQP
jgi:hypothetical protein